MCIVVLVYSASLLQPTITDPEKYKAIHWYMGLGVIIAVIAAATGLSSKLIDNMSVHPTQKQVDDLNAQISGLNSELTDAKMKYQQDMDAKQKELDVLKGDIRGILVGKEGLLQNLQVLPENTHALQTIHQEIKDLQALVK